jgi:hypothetical protein
MTEVSKTHMDTCCFDALHHDYFMYQMCMFISHMKYILDDVNSNFA